MLTLRQADGTALTAFLDTLFLVHTAPRTVAGLPSAAVVAHSALASKVQQATQRRIELSGGSLPPALPPAVEDITAAGAGLAEIPALLLAASATRLDLSGNQIQQVPSLSGCPHLATLVLADNRLRDFCGVSSLRHLDLRANRLVVCPLLAPMPLLEFLNLSDNLIKSVAVTLSYHI